MRGFGVFILAAMIAVMAIAAFTAPSASASENAIENIAANPPPSVSGVPAIEPVVVEATSSRTYRRTLIVLRTPRVIYEARTARRIARQTAKTDIEVTTSPGRVYDRRPGLLGKLAALVRTGPAPDH